MKKITSFTALVFGFLTVSAQQNPTTKTDSLNVLTEVIIQTSANKLKRDQSATVSKMPLKDIENPQVYNAIPSEVLKEQVVTNFSDAIKNATGVFRLWESTGRGGDGAEFYSMRGFAVQPTMINGLPGINNGSIDPANVDNIEVIKGPSGTLFGSSLISYGGLINIVTKKPYTYFGGEIAYNAGSYGLDRITADINVPLTKQNDVLFRINTAYQSENSFQDAGFNKSLFVAPALTYIVNDKLTFHINTEFTSRESANAPMIFLNRSNPLMFDSIELFENNYKNSFTTNNLTISNPTFNLQAQMMYKLSGTWTSQTVLSRSNSKTDGYYHYLFDNSDGSTFARWITKLNGETLTTDIQQNFIGDFKIGNMRNRIVAGLDYYTSNILNGSSGYVGNGEVNLLTQTDTGILSQEGVDNLLVAAPPGNLSAENKVYSAYVSDVINFTPSLSLMASLRVDHFTGKISQYSADDTKGQTAFSPKFGVVYQPVIDKVSIFANYMDGFMNVDPSARYDAEGNLLGNQSFDPEHANQFEFGVKTNLYKDRISLTASYYNITVKDRVMIDPDNVLNSIQGGEVQSKGFEVSIVATPITGLNLIAGFSNNDSEVTKDYVDSGYLGMRPEEAGPETLVNFWASYTVNEGLLSGFGLGFGGNHASEHKTMNRSGIGTFELPSYTILNSALTYNASRFAIALKLNNMLNDKYYTGWSTVTPQRLRNVTAALTYKF